MREAEPIFHNLLTMPQPAIASIRGACAGAAVGFASCCDFILACESAFFLIAQVHIGASPDGATTYALPRKIGPAKALEMALVGGRVAAREAHAGDPAEDLAYCKHLVESVLPWAEFMQAYQAAGGEQIAEERMRFFTIMAHRPTGDSNGRSAAHV